MARYLHIRCVVKTDRMSAHEPIHSVGGHTRRKSLETKARQGYLIHSGRDLGVPHRETWGHQFDEIVASSAYGSCVNTDDDSGKTPVSANLSQD